MMPSQAIWCSAVLFVLLPSTVLLAAVCIFLVALTPLFEIINFVRGRRTGVSRDAVATFERAQPICQTSAPHMIDVNIVVPSGKTEVWRVHYFKTDAFPGRKENMVLIHGVASGGAGYPPEVLTHLSTRYNVYSITLPGAGQPATPRSLQRATAVEAFDMLTQAIERFMLAGGLEGAVVVAHSFGAYVSMRTVLRYPALISKLILVSPCGFLPWLGTYGAIWALYFHLRPVHGLLRAFGVVARWVVHALLDLMSASAVIRYWLGILMVPSGVLDQLVSRCIHFNYLCGASHWRWPLLPTVINAGCKTKLALMAGQFDSITPVSQCAAVSNLLQVPFYQVSGGSHEVWRQHRELLPSLEKAIAEAAVPSVPQSVLAEMKVVMHKGAFANTFDTKTTAIKIAELEDDLGRIAAGLHQPTAAQHPQRAPNG